MSPTTTTQRSTAAKKAASTRRANARRRSAAAKRAAVTRELDSRTPLQQAADYAERAVLIPVGAALVARDTLVEGVTEAAKPYRQRETAQRQLERDLRRFERRGTTARNRVERELKRTRTRVERELRQRRNRVQRVVRQNRTRVRREVKSLRRNGQKLATDVQERVASAS
jgi:hypothetical protein